MKLYMINLGGKVEGCNLEVHDVQFLAADRIDDTVELLKRNWYGKAEKLHIDSYKLITGADGHAVRLTKEKQESGKQLYFVQLGGYRKDTNQELHEIGLLIGDSLQEVKERAVKELQTDVIQNHVDSIVRVEDCLISVDGAQYYLELSKSQEAYELAPDWFGYRRLDIEHS